MSIAPTIEQMLDLADGLSAHPDLLLLRGLLAGASGSGKSSTSVVLLEEASRIGVNSAIIAPTDDWYGIGSSADETQPGLDHVQFGGEFGDLALRVDMGAAIARMVADGMPVLCVIDRLSLDDRATFVADFCEALLELNRNPLVLVVDEAHLLCPMRSVGKSDERARCRDAIIAVVTTGRKPAQIGIWLITQRLSRLHTDARELADVSIIHKLRGGNDQKAARSWVEDHLPDPAAFRRVGMLDRGEAFVVAPDFDIAGVYHIRMKHTFDSSASGSVLSQVDRRPPAGRSAVDLSAVEAALGEAVERAKAEDPEHLRKDLEKACSDLANAREELGQARQALWECARIAGADVSQDDGGPRSMTTNDAGGLIYWATQEVQDLRERADEANSVTEIVEVPTLNEGEIDAVQVALEDLKQQATEVSGAVALLHNALEMAQEIRSEVKITATSATPPSLAVSDDLPVFANGTWPEPEQRSSIEDVIAPLVALGLAARDILSVLAQFPAGLTMSQISLLTGRRARGGSWNTAIKQLKDKGCVVEVSDGLRAIDEGLRQAPESNPLNKDDVIARWRISIPAPAREILDILLENPTTSYNVEALASLTGRQPRGGSWNTSLKVLRDSGLVVVPTHGKIMLNGDLLLAPAPSSAYT